MSTVYSSTNNSGQSVTGLNSAAAGKWEYNASNETEGTQSQSTQADTWANNEVAYGTFSCSRYVSGASDLEPGADGTSTGTFSFSFEVTVGDAAVTITNVWVHRVNTTDVSQASVAETTATFPVALSAGTHFFTWSSPALGTWSAGDYLLVEIDFDNTSEHGGDETITWRYGGTANHTQISAPWTIDHTPAGPAAGLRTLGLTGVGI